MAELGNTLSRTRRARGITLEDAERDTHVSRRYLQALENEEFTAFPAPVYARGFLRTYARYLGLNPEELVRVFPNGDLTVDITPLPSVQRPEQQLINVNWVVAGVVMIFLFGAGMLLLRGGDDPTVVQPPRQTAVAGATNPVPAGSNTTQSQLPLQQQSTQPVQGRTIGPVSPGRLPDFVGADLASSLVVLSGNQIDYAIISANSQTVPRGIVISQTPSPGSRSDGVSVTLVVSSGPPL
jgi:cytoskeletal protein RodZ